MLSRFLPLVPLVFILACTVAFAGPDAVVRTGLRFLDVDGRSVLQLNTPWLATGDWKPVRTFPADGPGQIETIPGGQRVTRVDTGPQGTWKDIRTTSADSLTLRYEFDLKAGHGASHLQWYWRLEPDRFDQALADSDGEGKAAPRSIAGLSVDPLRAMTFVLPDAEISVSCSAKDGGWTFRDARANDWAKCYRLEYNRDLDPQAASGWFEVTIRSTPVTDPIVPLTAGPESNIRGIRLRSGQPLNSIDRKLSALILWHTAAGPASRGQAVGQVNLQYADGTKALIPLEWDVSLTSPTDDPRDLPGGALERLPDRTPAWLSTWHNPRPDSVIHRIDVQTLSAGWRLLAAAGVDAGAGERRTAVVLAGLRPRALAEEATISLDGAWKFQPAGGEERDIPVPAMWDRLPGFHGVREGVYRRELDVPEALEGQRVALRFDAVGDWAEVVVNGHVAGEHLGPLVPFEVDITGLVDAPSRGNLLEVRVRDDSFFSTPRKTTDWRNQFTPYPRGMGQNNRKGLFQSVSLVGRPPVSIVSVRVQTSVRQKLLTVTYELFNSRRETVKARLSGAVHPNEGGAAVMTLPETPVELPGFVTTTVTISAPFDNVTLWQPDHPALYSLRSLLLNEKGDRLERKDIRFGFREIWFEGIHFFLNGIRCNLRGESPSYGEKVDLFSTREAATDMIRRFQKANFNALRFHAMPAPPHVLDVCDELGMLVIDESGVYSSWGMLLPGHPGWMEACRDHLSRWVRRDRNHPAVVLWSAENEGLNVSALTPAMLAEFRKIIDANDGTRPVIFDGDGTAYGVSPASEKHYVWSVKDLMERGGVSSGYGHDLRNDIYWAAEYHQDVPLGCGEFLFPYEPALRSKVREVVYMMGLQTRGYRFADWFDIRPYNPSYCGFLGAEGVSPGYEEAYDVIVKSFAPVAVFDKDYDALGPFPLPPKLKAGKPEHRTLIVYNDTFAGDQVVAAWTVVQNGKQAAGSKKALTIQPGCHTTMDITFTPESPGPLDLTLISLKNGKEQFRDIRKFQVEPPG